MVAKKPVSPMWRSGLARRSRSASQGQHGRLVEADRVDRERERTKAGLGGLACQPIQERVACLPEDAPRLAPAPAETDQVVGIRPPVVVLVISGSRVTVKASDRS
jgi:hypothetical protein